MGQDKELVKEKTGLFQAKSRSFAGRAGVCPADHLANADQGIPN